MTSLDKFADLLADGYEPGAAALMLGFTPSYGRTMLQKLIKRLGPQAR